MATALWKGDLAAAFSCSLPIRKAAEVNVTDTFSGICVEMSQALAGITNGIYVCKHSFCPTIKTTDVCTMCLSEATMYEARSSSPQ